jgi:uracil-DNA glycosylase
MSEVKVAGTLPAPFNLWELLPKDWQEISERKVLDEIQNRIGLDFQPKAESVFAAFATPLQEVKALIVGQDPYPNPDHAMGLAFSVPASVTKYPPTLINIYKELKSDLGIDRVNGDLSDWANQGVLLLNRSLTIGKSGSISHLDYGWDAFTEQIIKALAQRGVKAILWGKHAQSFEKYFSSANCVSSAHPSPLSAYRGFFGSKPFCAVNEMLKLDNLSPINW